MTAEERLFYSIDYDDTVCLASLIQEGGVDVNHIFYGACPLSKSHWSALHLCCEKGRYQCAKTLLQAGADPNIPDKYGQSCLMYAVSCGWAELVHLLLSHRADVTIRDFTSKTVMHTVATTDDTNILELLLQFGGNLHRPDLGGRSPLWLAASGNTGVEMLQVILKHTLMECDLNTRDSRRGRNALQAAIMNTDNGLYHKVQELTDRGIDTLTADFSHMTPFMNVIKRWQESQAKSCLHSSLRQELKKCLVMLVNSGYDVNVVTTGPKLLDHDGSALHMAARYGLCELIHFLVTKFNADVNCKNSKDQTPIFLTAQWQHFNAARILVDNHCNLFHLSTCKIRSRWFCGSAFQFALELGLVDMALFLYHAGYSLKYEDYLTDELDIPEVLQRNRKLKDLLQWLKLKQDSNQPSTLSEICFRLIGYKVLPRDNNKGISSLPLPQYIKDDLSYKGMY